MEKILIFLESKKQPPPTPAKKKKPFNLKKKKKLLGFILLMQDERHTNITMTSLFLKPQGTLEAVLNKE